MTPIADKILAVGDSFSAAGVPFAFGGAIALAYAIEEPRGTCDVDVNVFVAPDGAGAVVAALPAGVKRVKSHARSIEAGGQMRLFWGRTPLDLFFSVHRFHELAARRVRRVPFLDTTIPVLDATDLAVCKALDNRSRHWADLEAMRDVGSVDVDDAEGWLVRLLGDDDDRVVRFRELFRG